MALNMNGDPEAGAAKYWIIAIIAAALFAAGWYYYRANPGRFGQPSPPATDAATAQLQNQSSADDVNSIEADLNVSDFQNLDQEVGDINSSLNQ